MNIPEWLPWVAFSLGGLFCLATANGKRDTTQRAGAYLIVYALFLLLTMLNQK